MAEKEMERKEVFVTKPGVVPENGCPLCGEDLTLFGDVKIDLPYRRYICRTCSDEDSQLLVNFHLITVTVSLEMEAQYQYVGIADNMEEEAERRFQLDYQTSAEMDNHTIVRTDL